MLTVCVAITCSAIATPALSYSLNHRAINIRVPLKAGEMFELAASADAEVASLDLEGLRSQTCTLRYCCWGIWAFTRPG